MKERPILMSDVPVRGCLDGSKTQTRRIIKPGASQKWLLPETIDKVVRWEYAGEGWWTMAVKDGHVGSVLCPYGPATGGDRLWVRETWRCFGGREYEYQREQGAIRYRADERYFEQEQWRPSIHMPRWASRLALEVTDVRVERLQDISEADAVAEGCSATTMPEEWTALRATSHGGHELISLHAEPSANTIAEQGLSRVRHEPARLVQSAAGAFQTLWESINGAGSWVKNPWVWVVSFRRLP